MLCPTCISYHLSPGVKARNAIAPVFGSTSPLAEAAIGGSRRPGPCRQAAVEPPYQFSVTDCPMRQADARTRGILGALPPNVAPLRFGAPVWPDPSWYFATPSPSPISQAARPTRDSLEADRHASCIEKCGLRPKSTDQSPLTKVQLTARRPLSEPLRHARRLRAITALNKAPLPPSPRERRA